MLLILCLFTAWVRKFIHKTSVYERLLSTECMWTLIYACLHLNGWQTCTQVNDTFLIVNNTSWFLIKFHLNKLKIKRFWIKNLSQISNIFLIFFLNPPLPPTSYEHWFFDDSFTLPLTITAHKPINRTTARRFNFYRILN